MTLGQNSYTRYSFGLLIAWSIALLIIWNIRGAAVFHSVLLVAAGYFLGWLSTTIYRIIHRP